MLLGLCHLRLIAAGVLPSQTVLLGFSHPRFCGARALPFQIYCCWRFAIPDCVLLEFAIIAAGVLTFQNYALLELCHPRLIAAGVFPYQTVSYWGFVIPELCATGALPSQIVCCWGLATPGCALLSICHPRLCAARISLTQIKHPLSLSLLN